MKRKIIIINIYMFIYKNIYYKHIIVSFKEREKAYKVNVFRYIPKSIDDYSCHMVKYITLVMELPGHL